MKLRDDVKKLYEGKYFYEIVKVLSGRYIGTLQLIGPLDNIYYTSPAEQAENKIKELFPRKGHYEFVQVVDGKPVAAFTKEEILVTDRIL